MVEVQKEKCGQLGDYAIDTQMRLRSDVSKRNKVLPRADLALY